MLTRRQMLQHSGAGFGALAAQWLLARDGLLAEDAAASALMARAPHFAPKARAVIFLFMYGGPSHVDLFDEKPALAKWHGKAIPVWKDSDAFMGSKTKNVAMASPYRFARHGESGISMSETYPHLARHADKLCVIRSMHAESNNHAPALFQMNSGSILAGRPCMGSWATYGLGSESDDLPGFVVLLDHQGAPVNGAMNWSNGFMPAAYQGTRLDIGDEPIRWLNNPQGIPAKRQQAKLALL
ncbi:MAG TPA: DUF1501 domain-containing protein, partial [Caulifigura sp.]|nr:DUF1501 domain-containing protein [Caulifigura sp.]